MRDRAWRRAQYRRKVAARKRMIEALFWNGADADRLARHKHSLRRESLYPWPWETERYPWYRDEDADVHTYTYDEGMGWA